MMAVLLISCTRQEETGTLVRFNISLDAGQTKAYEAAEAATHLLVGVLDASGNPMNDFNKVVVREPNQPFSFCLPLVNGMSYQIMLLAQAPDTYVIESTYLGENGSALMLRHIPVAATQPMNRHDMAAFAGKLDVTAPAPEFNVLLTNTCSQINLASSSVITDIDAVTITVHGAPVEYDLLTGGTSGSQDVVFSGDCLSGQTFYELNYIGFGYLIAGQTGTYSADISLKRGSIDYVYYIPNIPLRPNYRTNLMGEF